MTSHPTEPKLPESLEAIRAALAAGPTPGPWETVGSIVRTARRPEDMSGLLIADCGIHDPHRIETAAFIAACNPGAIAALLDALKARDAEIERLRGALDLAVDHIDMSALRISHCKDAAAIDQARATGGEKAK